jgi:DNA replication protein DnaC
VLDVPIDDPNFGILITCDCKQPGKERRRNDELRRLSELDAFAHKTFANFDSNVPGVQRAFRRAFDYATNPRGWLILFGNYGCGKTHLAAAIANEALSRHCPVIFTVVPDLLDHLRSTFGPSSEVAYDERFRTIRDVKLLILDDLGTENTTPWAREKLYQIINHRYNEELPTVITSNRQPEDIEKRIFSRMSDRILSEIIMIESGDYRMRTMAERKSRDYYQSVREPHEPRFRRSKQR